jgi:SynChlorMet cassette radical SAM/SPASM protein ScmF
MKEKNNKYQENSASSADYPLSQLYFYLTEGCNLACRHCYLSPKFDPDGKKHPVLPFKLFKIAIKEALPLGLNGVKLSGGEPLLHPDILAMLDIVYQEELSLVMETNGVLATPEIIKAIAKLETPFVSISLDSAEDETHDTIRGVTGSFKKATKAISAFADNGIPPQVIMSIMQVNAQQVEAVIELAEELGASSVKFNIIQPTGRGEALSKDDKGLQIKDLITLGRKVESELANQTGMELFFDYPPAFRSLGSLAPGDGCGVCGILSILGVLPSGEYALCGMGSHTAQLHFGRAGRDSLLKVWHENHILQDLRNGLPEKINGICRQCLMKHLCLGSCIAQNYYRTGSLWAPFWFCEQASAAGLFPDSRLDLTFKKKQKMI